MNNGHLQIRIYGVDGTARTFFQDAPELIHRTLQDLNPMTLFARDQIAITDADSVVTFPSAGLTRIDLMTDRLSVWDYPFALGALVELTEQEFMEFIHEPRPRQPANSASGTPVFLKLEMLHGQPVFLWMQVIAGLPPGRWQKIYSLLKERRLIFDLRAGGIGILNLANLVRASIHPEPSELAAGAMPPAVERPALRLAGSLH